MASSKDTKHGQQEHAEATNLVYYTIRGIDFDPKERILYTGDEIGYMQKWDMKKFLGKLAAHRDAFEESSKMLKRASSMEIKAFLTQREETEKSDFAYTDADISLVERWKAHKDAINHVSWVPELKMVASCSFDCNVYIWGSNPDRGTMEKNGSLILGNRADEPCKQEDNKYKHNRKFGDSHKWLITIDKKTRFKQELKEA